MLKIFSVCGGLMVLALTACATTEQLYEGPALARSEIAFITTSASADTQALIEKTFGSAPGFRAATLHMIDGKAGPNSQPPYQDIYNNKWDWGLKLELMPGRHSFVVMPNHHLDASTPKTSMTFEAAAGHEYFLGQIMQAGGTRYRWQALLVDQTTGTLVFPSTITWKPN